jgi:hypothetical protein
MASAQAELVMMTAQLAAIRRLRGQR